jgi:thioesterase domain-containing protein/acyl carrier protein
VSGTGSNRSIEGSATAEAESSSLRRTDLDLATPWQEPTSEAERKLAAVWHQVLGIDCIGTADDFFELGGDSFAATALAAEIEATFGVRFTPADIINLSTVAKQARTVAEDASSSSSKLPPHLIVGRAGGSRPPLFMVHGGMGFAFFKRAFIDEVGEDRPIYLFQAPGLDGRTEPLNSIEDVASTYIASMREIQPNGPYALGALCSGAFIALEMCNQLVEARQTIAHFILLDPTPAPRALAWQYPVKDKWRRPKFPKKQNWGIPNLLRHVRWSLRKGPDPFEQELRIRAKKLKRQKAIRQRRSVEVDGATPEERSYSPEGMLNASQRLYEAQLKHVPRPFAGKAVIFTNSKRAKLIVDGASFWRRHLDGIDCRVSKSTTHKDLFGAQIVETARFVKDVLQSPS